MALSGTLFGPRSLDVCWANRWHVLLGHMVGLTVTGLLPPCGTVYWVKSWASWRANLEPHCGPFQVGLSMGHSVDLYWAVF